MWRPICIFGSLSPAGKITAQEAAISVPLVLPSQRGLRHRTILPILQNPPPSGVGAYHVHGLAIQPASVSISVSISKYCCSFSFYRICFIYIFLICSFLWCTFFILNNVLLMWLFLFIFCVYFYINHSFSWLYCSFNIIFWS